MRQRGTTMDSHPQLTDVICWTRMQSESGQDIRSIIGRKELERRASDGLFFWGIGNAPSRRTSTLVAESESVDVIFSVMKGRPKLHDVAPTNVLAWGGYF